MSRTWLSLLACASLAIAGGALTVTGCGQSSKSSESYKVPDPNVTPPATNDAQSRRHGERSNGAQ